MKLSIEATDKLEIKISTMSLQSQKHISPWSVVPC